MANPVRLDVMTYKQSFFGTPIYQEDVQGLSALDIEVQRLMLQSLFPGYGVVEVYEIPPLQE